MTLGPLEKIKVVLRLPASNLGMRVRRADILIGQEVTDYQPVPEYPFFRDLEAGMDMSNCLPMPEGVTRWHNASYVGEPMLYAATHNNEVYLIAEDSRAGLTLYHYINANQDGTELKYSNMLPRRSITIRKENNSMNLNSLAAQSANARGMTPMNLNGGGNSAPAPAYAGNDGIGNANGDKFNIQATACAKGYVFGYIVRNAPSTSAKLKPIRDKNKTITGHEIQFVQTKPSGLISVLIGVPSRCVMRNGNVASPENISNGNVDFNIIDPAEMTYLDVNESVAIGLIQAWGGRLPEFKPNIIRGAREQWTPEEIQNSSEVSFVVPRTSKSQSPKALSEYIVHLKSTRGMLFTQDNVMCMRALVHLECPTTRGNDSARFGTKNDQEEFYLNESAFGMWRFRKVKENNKETGKTMAQVALSECPNDIWEKAYKQVKTGLEKDAELKDIDDGFGSRFFAQAGTAGSEHGFDNSRTNFYPWYQPPKEKKAEPVTAIAFRQVVPTKSGTGHRASTQPVLWKDNERHPMFAPYAKFADAVVSTGFMSREKLRGLGNRASRKGAGTKKVDGDAQKFLDSYLKSEAMKEAFENVQREYANNRAAQG